MDQASPSATTVDELNRYIAMQDFIDHPPIVEQAQQDWTLTRVPTTDMRLRPGGYVPGPVMMAAVDLVGWMLVFTRVGFTPMALTWDLQIKFLRPAHGADLMIAGRQTKFGKLCHSTHDLYMDGDPDRLVAHATTTYVLPPSDQTQP